jgi:predicted methyltransferase
MNLIFRRASMALLAPLVLGAAGCATPAGPAPTLTESEISRVVFNQDRSLADRALDARRKPREMLAFIGVRQGMSVLDLSAGGGYTTELLARAVGPTGRVVGQSAPRAANAKPPAAPEGGVAAFAAGPAGGMTNRMSSPEALAKRAEKPGLAPIEAVVRPFESPVPDALAQNGLDLATLMFNYHDLGHLGVDRSRMNQAVFAALKPGGTYVIADHAGRPGTGISESGSLHRVEEDFVRREVEAAGFKLVAKADFLRNPLDPRDQNTPAAGQSKDEFVLKFVKP